MIRTLYNKIPKLFIAKIRYFFSKTVIPQLPEGKRTYIFLAADYGNFGDIALTYVQRQLLTECYPEHKIVEVPATISYGYLKGYIESVREDDIVTIIAGGNMGDVWSWFERYRQLIVSKLSWHRIYQFPQTATYTNSQLGNNLLRSARKIYSNENVVLMAREEMSFDFMKREFNAMSYLVPDIVMTLQNRHYAADRSGILLCMRDDRERFLGDDVAKSITEILSKSGHDTAVIDTKVDKGFDYEHRYEMLESFINKISQSKLIVTDRLHGMIFAYISGTPAIVLPNSNKKVEMCYKLIENCGFIHFIPSYSSEVFESLLKTALNQKVDYELLAKRQLYFSDLIKDIINK